MNLENSLNVINSGVSVNGIDFLKKQLASYQAVFELMPLGVSILVDRTVHFANPAFDKIFGYDAGATLGLNTIEFYGDIEMYHRVGKEGYDCVKDGQVYVVESSMRHKNGMVIWCKMTGRSIDIDNIMAGSIWIVQDITEQKNAEEALQKREQAYKDQFYMNSSVILLMDQETGAIIDANEAAINFYGYTREEIITKNISEINIMPIKEVLHLMMTVSFSKGKHFHFHHRLADGSMREVEVSTSLVIFSDKKVLHSIIHDITDRKFAELALKESEERYKALFMRAGDGITILTVNGCFLEVNEAFASMHGYTVDEMKGMCLKDLDTVDSYDKAPERLEKLLSGEFMTFEVEHHHKAGYVFQLEVAASLLQINGEPYVQCFHRDITERKIMESKLLESERLSAVGEMSAGVAHDFNNSLQVIYGNLELALLNYNLSDELTKLLKAARASAGDASARVRQLQRFTQKKPNSEFVSLNLVNLIEQSIMQARPLWKDEYEHRGLQIDFVKSFAKNLYIDGDVGELGSVFHNLLKNAIEAMPNGGIITISTAQIDDEIYLSIGDSGSGMNESTRIRVFQPFFSTKGLELGRGLGMSAAYSIIRDHGGRIYVKDTGPSGTVIEIVFPIGKKQVNSTKCFDTTVYLISGSVLWVDDDFAIREVAQMYVETLGHHIDVAANGKEAIEQLKKRSYDLMITDIGMPGMSGWQLAENIKGQYAKMKVVVVTGWGSDISAEEMARFGVGYVIGKPIKLDQIKNLIGEVLQLKNKS
ncbi:MAG: PAS domain S-box protein [bacterium]